MQGRHEAGRFDEQVRRIAERFDEAWQGGKTPALADFLPPLVDPNYVGCLLELIKIDLQFRWSRGPGIIVEQYLQRFPALGPKETLDAALIYAEYQARHLHGDKPTLDTYVGRFPGQYQALQRLIYSRPIGAIEPPTTAPLETSQSKGQSLIIRAGHVLPFGGGYQLVRKLGSGSFAEVWEAKAPGGFGVAVKKLHHSVDQEEAQSDLRSLEYLKRLSHPYLLQTQASFLHEDYLFVVMELATGTLGDLLKKWLAQHEDGMPANEVLGYIKEAAEALDYMHSQDVHHRDIKPANLLHLQGHVKVGDFGLSRVLERSSNATVAGTYPYMAPEVLQRKASLQSDQYSLAKTYAHLRQGKRFVAMDLFALIQSCGKPVPLDPLPPTEQAVLQKALDTDPGKRFESCREFAAALEKALAPPPPPPPIDDAPRVMPAVTPSPPPSAWTRRLQTAFLALLLATLAAVLFLWLRQPAGFELLRPEKASLAASEVKTIHVSVNRFVSARPVEPIELTFDNLPKGVTFKPATIPANQSGADVEVRTMPDAAPGDYHINLHAVSTNMNREDTLDLKVTGLRYYLPPGWQPAEGATPIDGSNPIYYDKIDAIKGSERVRFLFIPADVPHAIAAPFYIMEDKVWFGLYSSFANYANNSDLLKNSQWREKRLNDGDPQSPVMGVLAPDAHELAQWLAGAKGLLPTTAQWDKAAGRFEREEGRDGPFEGTWPEVKAQVAVNLKFPIKRGQATKDRSFFRLRDMSGNGREWTRTAIANISGAEIQVDFAKLKKDGQERLDFYLRGRNFDAETPLFFKDIDNPEQRPGFELLSADPRPYIGFRVVIEP